jgi:hypothetical protein
VLGWNHCADDKWREAIGNQFSAAHCPPNIRRIHKWREAIGNQFSAAHRTYDAFSSIHLHLFFLCYDALNFFFPVTFSSASRPYSPISQIIPLVVPVPVPVPIKLLFFKVYVDY